MTRATSLTALRNAGLALDLGPDAAACRTSDGDVKDLSAELRLSLHDSLETVEAEWRRFEQIADCTPFQTFDWLAAWQRHIGRHTGVRPVIAVGSFVNGQAAFMLPLAVEPKRLAKRLCWLGQGVNDYNAPLLARDFSQRIIPERFRTIWQELRQRMQRDPRMRHDWIDMEQMPQMLGAQPNPFAYLDVSLNASGAHLMRLGDDWEKFYFEKRSSATRRHDRAKRRRLATFGNIRFVNGADPDDTSRMVEILMQQKSRSFARKGIPDVFARPGCKEFLLDLASNPRTRDLIHISRVEIGELWAAVNFGIVRGDCYYHFAASYDGSKLSHYGPGALHLREIMAYAIRRGLRRFDFTVGDEPYKLEWSDTHSKLWDYIAGETWRGWPASQLSKARFRLKRFMKQTPLVWRLVGRVRAALGSVRQATGHGGES